MIQNGNIGSETVKCVYKSEQDPHKNEYFVICHYGKVEQWRLDKSVPLVDVLESYEIFTTDSKGHTGQVIRPSRQSLDNIFGHWKEDFIIQKILDEGQLIPFHGSRTLKEGSFRITRSDATEVRSA